MEVSKVLIIGATGYVGQHIAKASLALGHPTYLLVRPQLPSNSNPDQRLELIRSFEASGAVILEGSLEDPRSLVEAMKQVDVVISAVGHDRRSHSGPTQLANQARIIEAIQEVGTIKRFVPSEFGVDVDRPDLHPLMRATLIDKVHTRRAIEKAGIPYTIVSANNLFRHFLDRKLSKTVHQSDPNLRTTYKIFGDGNTKAIYVSELDVGTYTIKAIDDPRTLNKIVYIRPCTNILTQKELLVLWEQNIGRSIDVSYVTQEEIDVQFEGSSHEEKLNFAFYESIFIRGVEFFDIDAHGIEATQLYGDEVTYINVENYLNELKNHLMKNPNKE